MPCHVFFTKEPHAQFYTRIESMAHSCREFGKEIYVVENKLPKRWFRDQEYTCNLVLRIGGDIEYREITAAQNPEECLAWLYGYLNGVTSMYKQYEALSALDKPAPAPKPLHKRKRYSDK